MEETRDEVISKIIKFREELKILNKKVEEFDKEDTLKSMSRHLGKFYKNKAYSREGDNSKSVCLHRIDGISETQCKLLSTRVIVYTYKDGICENSAEIILEDSFDPSYNYGEDEDRCIEIEASEFNEWLNFALEEIKSR